MKHIFLVVLILGSNAWAINADCDLKLTMSLKMTSPVAAHLASDQMRGHVIIHLLKDAPGIKQDINNENQLKNVTLTLDPKASRLTLKDDDDAGKPRTTVVPVKISPDFMTSKGGQLTVSSSDAKKLFASALAKLNEDTKKINAEVDLKNSDLVCLKKDLDLNCSLSVTGTAKGDQIPSSS